MGSGVEIAPSAESDLRLLFGLAKGAFAGERGWSDRRVLNALASDVVFVAKDPGLAGYVALRREEAGVVVVEQIFVAPGHEQRGIGHRLLAHAEGYAIAERARTLRIVVEEDNRPARNFYLRSGFVQVGERGPGARASEAGMSTGVSLKYEIVAASRAGKERVHEYASEEALGPGAVVRLQGRYWLIEHVDSERTPARAVAKPARNRLHLRHPEGREEFGAFRRFRPGAPRLGHAFTTTEDRESISWEIISEELAYDEEGEPYSMLVAERDYAELEELPDHELEHTLAVREAEDLPDAAAAATLARAAEAGLVVELVALEPGEEPDWTAAERFIDALVIEEVEDDLIELCGVNPDADPRETWLETVKERLRSDLERFRADLEGDHDQIEEWDFRDGRIFASVGSFEDEAHPDSGNGWMCRLADSEALGAAGFERVRKSELEPS